MGGPPSCSWHPKVPAFLFFQINAGPSCCPPCQKPYFLAHRHLVPRGFLFMFFTAFTPTYHLQCLFSLYTHLGQGHLFSIVLEIPPHMTEMEKNLVENMLIDFSVTFADNLLSICTNTPLCVWDCTEISEWLEGGSNNTGNEVILPGGSHSSTSSLVSASHKYLLHIYNTMWLFMFVCYVEIPTPGNLLIKI